MTQPQKTISFDPALFTFTVDGREIQAFAEGESFKATFTSDRWSTKTGVKGTVQRAINRDPTGMIEVTLIGGHKDNAYLARRAREQRADVTDLSTVQARNAAGEEVVFSADSWIENEPGISAGADLSNRTWKFKCGHLDIDHGSSE